MLVKPVPDLIRWPVSSVLNTLDDSLRSPCGPPYGRSTRHALLSGMRRDDDNGINQEFPSGLIAALCILNLATPGARYMDGPIVDRQRRFMQGF